MTKYFIRELQAEDMRQVAAIYNSNRRFLRNHLGADAIDDIFIADEAAAMAEAGFLSCVIVNEDTQALVGVLDHRPGREAYLSLLMLTREAQGRGLGRGIYELYEAEMLSLGCEAIRIDVVCDYTGNLLPFWQGLGFSACGEVTLKWGGKQSRAAVMRKRIREESQN